MIKNWFKIREIESRIKDAKARNEKFVLVSYYHNKNASDIIKHFQNKGYRTSTDVQFGKYVVHLD